MGSACQVTVAVILIVRWSGSCPPTLPAAIEKMQMASAQWFDLGGRHLVVVVRTVESVRRESRIRYESDMMNLCRCVKQSSQAWVPFFKYQNRGLCIHLPII
ncbi:hypothetical protein EDB86DRAFT_488775 [Lactarius hatsudake]|nr:hypothetical protein EDB86DRAFT_488775 [Lactarius hatsudake]